jgi:hypothetical protein
VQFNAMAFSVLIAACILPLALAVNDESDTANEVHREVPNKALLLSQDNPLKNSNEKVPPVPNQESDIETIIEDAKNLEAKGKIGEAATNLRNAVINGHHYELARYAAECCERAALTAESSEKKYFNNEAPKLWSIALDGDPNNKDYQMKVGSAGLRSGSNVAA